MLRIERGGYATVGYVARLFVSPSARL